MPYIPKRMIATDDSAYKLYHTGRWIKARKRYIEQHPVCECDKCKELGRLRTASVVHHLIPHQGNPVLFWDEHNWQAVSKTCHDGYLRAKEKLNAINKQDNKFKALTQEDKERFGL